MDGAKWFDFFYVRWQHKSRIPPNIERLKLYRNLFYISYITKYLGTTYMKNNAKYEYK